MTETDDYAWTEKFISAVKTRPALYDKSHPSYSNRNVVHQNWEEVCGVMIADWDNITDKVERVFLMKQKWRNLMTCFRRELRKQSEMPVHANSKRRKYLYFDQLLFMLPIIDDPSIRRVPDESPSYISDDSVSEILPSSPPPSTSAKRLSYSTQQPIQCPSQRISYAQTVSYSQPPNFYPQPTETHNPDIRRKTIKTKKPKYKDKLLKILENVKNDDDAEVDEDKTFLMSLLPSFRRMNHGQKLETKMAFLSAIKEITIPASSAPYSGGIFRQSQQQHIAQLRENGRLSANYNEASSQRVQNTCSTQQSSRPPEEEEEVIEIGGDESGASDVTMKFENH